MKAKQSNDAMLTANNAIIENKGYMYRYFEPQFEQPLTFMMLLPDEDTVQNTIFAHSRHIFSIPKSDWIKRGGILELTGANNALNKQVDAARRVDTDETAAMVSGPEMQPSCSGVNVTELSGETSGLMPASMSTLGGKIFTQSSSFLQQSRILCTLTAVDGIIISPGISCRRVRPIEVMHLI
ncbi:hypothetical protein CEUSTIGMA_g1522.t1 [Chlamydomonas eustigma]|uniref:Uncharacterized protein n=1 Tax=Chlamydomonas eustigma TaxID=1157962 RepID=A0A250WTW2_9CHLO|nr:hypothetical protein CEUSTIGMA_g1522.t1 [Chlamydomonas eustigma]|eukprot:GAX74072.1 hypothetical protein CEUSTIGMA_g1522.t1 [Chlamydomonas eustigma]